MPPPSVPTRDRIEALLVEYDRALSHTDDLWMDLRVDEVHWRADEESSGIGWHLGHQPAVAHFMVRNLTAAEPSPDPDLDRLMDSATPPRERGDLPDLDRLASYRATVAERVRFRIGEIAAGNVGAPEQLGLVGVGLLAAVINHEYQHSTWIAEVRREVHGREIPPLPTSPLLRIVDGYTVVSPDWT